MDKSELLLRLADIEWDDFEVKEARSELPKNICETVSAFANSSGGWIVLGVSQKGKKFEICRVEKPEKIKQSFTTVLRSHSKFNVLISPVCKKYSIDDKIVLAFYITSSEQKPVYFNSLINTFVRTASGDQRATDSEINALFREQSFGIRSDLIVEGFSFNNLNTGALNTYRNRVKNQNPQMLYNDLSDIEFFEKLGVTKNGMPTYGGLLVLGKADSIRQKFSDFWLITLKSPVFLTRTLKQDIHSVFKNRKIYGSTIMYLSKDLETMPIILLKWAITDLRMKIIPSWMLCGKGLLIC